MQPPLPNLSLIQTESSFTVSLQFPFLPTSQGSKNHYYFHRPWEENENWYGCIWNV